MDRSLRQCFEHEYAGMRTILDRSLDWEETFIPHVSRGYAYTADAHREIMWTAGFWPGVLWLFAEATGESKYAERARAHEAMLAAFLKETKADSGHDLAFNSCCRRPRITA